MVTLPSYQRDVDSAATLSFEQLWAMNPIREALCRRSRPKPGSDRVFGSFPAVDRHFDS